MKTKFKIFQKNNLEKLLKNKNFRNNQNYVLSEKRYIKAYNFYSHYWLFNKYLYIVKVSEIRDYNQ